MNNVRMISLLLGAAQCEIDRIKIAPEYIPQIDTARAKLALMSGPQAIAAVVEMRKMGLQPVDLRVLERRSKDDSAERSRQPGEASG